ncbi:MAG TPA: TadE/TadG family type IV pilus assembly protein [Aliidongia sp.]|nr:TadE/TadG family type IV pilus assembly protein [Aliidongia sp.]
MRGRRLFRGIPRDRSGTAAVEFAMIVPVMLTMWLGMMQFAQYETVDAKTLMAAQSISDIVAQVGTWQAGQFSDIVSAANVVLAPLPPPPTGMTTPVTVDVVGVAYDSNNNPTYTSNGGWRCTSTGGPAKDPSVPLSLTAGLGSTGQMIILVTVKFAYQPAITYGVIGARTLSEQALNRPRLGSTIAQPC